MTAFSKNPPEGSGQSLNVTYRVRSLNEKVGFCKKINLAFIQKIHSLVKKAQNLGFSLFLNRFTSRVNAKNYQIFDKAC